MKSMAREPACTLVSLGATYYLGLYIYIFKVINYHERYLEIAILIYMTPILILLIYYFHKKNRLVLIILILSLLLILWVFLAPPFFEDNHLDFEFFRKVYIQFLLLSSLIGLILPLIIDLVLAQLDNSS